MTRLFTIDAQTNGVLNYVVKWVGNSAAVDLDVGWAGHHTEEGVHESFVSLLRAVVELFVLSIDLFYVFLGDEDVVVNQEWKWLFFLFNLFSCFRLFGD